MNQQYLFDPIPADKFDLLSKEELIELLKAEQDLRLQFQRAYQKQQEKILKEEQKSFSFKEQLVAIKNKLFGQSSEKSPKKARDKNANKDSKRRVQLPSTRYSNADIIEKDVEFDQLPDCPCCTSQMMDSGLTEDSEYLTVIPKRFYIVRQKRHKYKCSHCQSALVTAPAIPRIKPGSSYSDEMIIDVSMSKYLDLLPIDRYVQMAKRSGVPGIPPNSLIQLTHHLADFLLIIYQMLKKEVFTEEINHADETPHRMLEGDKRSNWYLWGFSTDKSSYFEARDTRSGDVASELLKDSNCRYLMTDVYSGYNKAIRQANEYRDKKDLPKIEPLYCNAHARRKFKEAEVNFSDEVKLALWCYQRIYKLQKNKAPSRIWQKLFFTAIHEKSLQLRSSYPSSSKVAKAVNYFIKNYDGLTRFLTKDNLPIDNNAQERQLRNPVIGRKIWYGTHSKRGAKTNSILFSIVESCKLNDLNPRTYLTELIRSMHQGGPAKTPYQFAQERSSLNSVPP